MGKYAGPLLSPEELKLFALQPPFPLHVASESYLHVFQFDFVYFGLTGLLGLTVSFSA